MFCLGGRLFKRTVLNTFIKRRRHLKKYVVFSQTRSKISKQISGRKQLLSVFLFPQSRSLISEFKFHPPQPYTSFPSQTEKLPIHVSINFLNRRSFSSRALRFFLCVFYHFVFPFIHPVINFDDQLVSQ